MQGAERLVVPGKTGIVEGQGRGRDETGKQAGEEDSLLCPPDLDGAVPDERDPRDEDHHPPELVGIDRSPGAESPVGEDGEHDHADEEQPEPRVQLLLPDAPEQAVQLRLVVQHHGGHHRSSRGQRHLADHGQSAEREGEEGAYRAGDADIRPDPLAQQVGRRVEC